MKITKERVIPGKIALNSEELDVVVDFKILLERIVRNMDELNIVTVGNITRHGVLDLRNVVDNFYKNVGVDYSVDKEGRA